MTTTLTTLLKLVLSLLLIVQGNPSISDSQKQEILKFTNQVITTATKTITNFVDQSPASLPVSTTIKMCDYPNPPINCHYVNGSDFNSTTQCGMVLSCENTSQKCDLSIDCAVPPQGYYYKPVIGHCGCGILTPDNGATTNN